MRRKLNVKLVASFLAGLLCASGAVHFLHGYQLQRNAYRLLELGDRAVEENDDVKALTCYSQYLNFLPNDADTVQKYAQVLDRHAATGADRVRLILLMEQVLRVKPNEHPLRFRLVHHLIALERHSEAIDNLKKLQSHWTDKAEVLHMLGWCQEAKKEYTQAVASFEAAILINPKQIRSYTLLAEVLQDRLNLPDEAQKAMDDLVRANPDTYQAYLSRARFRRRRGNDEAAESDLQVAYKLGHDKPEVILEVADAARGRGNWEEAVKLLKEGMTRFPDHADFNKEMAWVKILSEERAEAIRHLEDGLRQTPKSNELAILLIDLLIDQQHYQAAREKIGDLLKAGLKPTLPNYLEARLAIADQQWSEAIQLLESVRQELGPSSEWNSRVHVLLGLSYRQIGAREQELQAFRRAVQAEPTWIIANVELGAALLNNGRIEEASQALEPLRTAKGLPAGYWILLSRCRLYRQLRLPEAERRWDELEESLGQAVKAEPKSVVAATVRAEILAACRDFAGAKAVLEKTRAEHPGDNTVWCAQADLAVRQNQFGTAEKILDQADDCIEVRLAKCRLWGQRGTPEDRMKLTRLGDARVNTYTVEQRARLWRELADTWQRLGEGTRAEALLREVARVLPKDLGSRSALLDIAVQKNQTSLARVWLDEIRAIEGEQGWLWRYGVAALLVHEARGRRSQLDEARKKLQELEKVHPNWSRAAVLSGTISELEGNYQQAVEEYARALELGETQPRVLASLLGLLMQRREFGKAETEVAKYEQKLALTKELARLGAEVALLMREKQYAKLAVKRAEQAVALPARDYRDALWLARIYQAAGENLKAEALLRDSLDQAGHAPDTWIAWMDHLQQTNQRGQALKDLERLTKELPASRQPLTIARCYEALQMPDQAGKAYQDALRAASDDFILLAHAADFYRRADLPEEAQRWYERLLDPDLAAPAEYTVPARRRLAVLLAQRDAASSKQALALLNGNRASRGDAATDERIRLFIHSLTPSARQDAIRNFEDSLRLEPPTPEERLLLAQMLESADRLGQARTQLSELVGEYPATPQYLVRFARVLIRLNELDEAQRQLARLEPLEPDSERVRAVRAALARARKKDVNEVP